MSNPTIIEFAGSATSHAGTEPLTPAWDATLRLFYGLPLSDDALAFLVEATGRSQDALRACEGAEFCELWARVGRRGRKSATASLVAVYEALYGGHEKYLIPGEFGLVAVISKDLSGCGTVARFCKTWLDAIGVGYTETTQGSMRLIPIEGTQIAIALLPCSSEAPRGPAIPVAVLDEIAFWDTSDRYAQPDSEILGALRPAQAQFPRRKTLAISSPFGEEGVHYNTIEASLGNDADRKTLAVEGPTWIWNPSISEATTREIEPDEKKWSREFKAEPGSTVSQALDTDDVKAAFEPHTSKLAASYLAIDASSLRGDAFAWLVARETSDGLALAVTSVSGIEGDQLRRHSMADVVGLIATDARSSGASHVFGDQREEASLRSMFSDEHLGFTSYAWSEPSKDSAFQLLRRLLREHRLHLVEHEQLRKQMLACKAHLRPSGRTHYATNGLDYLSALVTLLHAALAKQLLTGAGDFAGLTPIASYRTSAAAREPDHDEGAFGWPRLDGWSEDDDADEYSLACTRKDSHDRN